MFIYEFSKDPSHKCSLTSASNEIDISWTNHTGCFGGNQFIVVGPNGTQNANELQAYSILFQRGR